MISKRSPLLLLLVGCLLPISLAAQTTTSTPPPTAPDQKAEAIVARGIEVLGGNSYLHATTALGRGLFTSFKDGISQIPAKFLDYIAYPDRERTEFVGEGIRVI